ncbi:MAG: DNA starvation/stationary phase protection protein Dps [Phycisphaerae bacterium]|nr:DNA starvation/stationary phase protection protein Dps [Phycisphaerae bacterium]
MNKTRNDLPERTRLKMVELLNARLADAVDLLTQVKSAHWNVKGANFIALHRLFDEVHDTVESAMDDLAERAAQLGGVALGTARIAAKSSNLKEYPLEIVSGIDHVEALADRLAAFGKLIRESIDTADKAGDTGTADLFTEISRAMDKMLWFVESHAHGGKE